jgi:hypothetical protein
MFWQVCQKKSKIKKLHQISKQPQKLIGNFRGIEPLNCLAIPLHPAKG